MVVVHHCSPLLTIVHLYILPMVHVAQPWWSPYIAPRLDRHHPDLPGLFERQKKHENGGQHIMDKYGQIWTTWCDNMVNIMVIMMVNIMDFSCLHIEEMNMGKWGPFDTKWNFCWVPGRLQRWWRGRWDRCGWYATWAQWYPDETAKAGLISGLSVDSLPPTWNMSIIVMFGWENHPIEKSEALEITSRPKIRSFFPEFCIWK